MNEPGFIYFVQEQRTGSLTEDFIKIGWSRTVTRRVQMLGCGSPFPLHVLASIAGTHKQEKKLHRIFSPHRLRGEWFKPHEDLLQIIRTGVLPEFSPDGSSRAKRWRVALALPEGGRELCKAMEVVASSRGLTLGEFIIDVLRKEFGALPPSTKKKP